MNVLSLPDLILMIAGLIFLFGLLFGSFLNVCIYRIPRIHLMLTTGSFTTLQALTDQHFEQQNRMTGRLRNWLYTLLEFFGIHRRGNEEPIPQEMLNKLSSLQDTDYPTLNDFVRVLDDVLRPEDADRYSNTIVHHALSKPESIVFPASHCPACQTPIAPWDNIPVISFLMLRGTCRTCQASISWRYPLIELLTALIFSSLFYRFGLATETLVYLAFAAALIVLSGIDLDHRLIPNAISLPGIMIGLLASPLLPITWMESLLGILTGGGIILLTGYLGTLFFKKDAMGGGDVKLLAMIGAVLGWKMVFLTILFGSVTGAVIGIIYKLLTNDEYIPFGPFLSFGALSALYVGPQFLNWYWSQAFPLQ